MLAAAIVYWVSAQLSGLVVPLVIAAGVGILFVLLVDLIDRYVPRRLAAPVGGFCPERVFRVERRILGV